MAEEEFGLISIVLMVAVVKGISIGTAAFCDLVVGKRH